MKTLDLFQNKQPELTMFHKQALEAICKRSIHFDREAACEELFRIFFLGGIFFLYNSPEDFM
jgi:hypothetical protein